MDQVKVTPDDVGKYFTNRMAAYRIPERVQVVYVEFNPTNYYAQGDAEMAKRTNVTQNIEEEYIREGTNSFKDTNGMVLSAADAKARIKERYRFAFGYGEARRAAALFGTKLSNQTNHNSAEDLEKLAAAEGLPTKITPPFDTMTGLDEVFPAEFKRKALALTDGNQVEWTPIPGTNAIYVIARKKKIPSEMPALATIMDKVTTDYKHSQALDMAFKAGPAFHTNLTNGLALKKSFKDLCAESKVTPISIPPFSMASETQTNLDPRLNFNLVRNYSLNTELGKATPFIQLGEGGLVIYVESRSPVSSDKVQKELPDFTNRLRSERQSEAVNQWLRKEMEQAKVSVPREELPPASPTPSPVRPRKQG